MANITGIMLNWKREANVVRIVAGWRESGIIRDGIVWNNNPAAPFTHDWANVITATRNLGLYTRFAAASLALDECLLIQDDDLALPRESLARLYEEWQADPDVLHGVFGRAPKADGGYARNLRGETETPVVLTRVLLARREYAGEFFRHAPRFDAIQRNGVPYGNGEDIIFSYCAMRASGRLNRLHRVAVQELPAPHAVHAINWNAHVAHRTRLMRACEAWLRA